MTRTAIKNAAPDPRNAEPVTRDAPRPAVTSATISRGTPPTNPQLQKPPVAGQPPEIIEPIRRALAEVPNAITMLITKYPDARTLAEPLSAPLAAAQDALKLFGAVENTVTRLVSRDGPTVRQMATVSATARVQAESGRGDNQTQRDAMQRTYENEMIQKAERELLSKVEDQFKKRASGIATRFLTALREEAEKSVMGFSVRSNQPSALLLPIDDRWALENWEMHYRQQGVENLLKSYNDAIESGDERMALIIEASTPKWLMEVERAGRPTEWRPGNPRDAAAVREEASIAKLLLDAFRQRIERRVAPAVLLATEIIQRERELFCRICGIDGSKGGNVRSSAEFWKLSKSGRLFSLDAISDNWPTRYLTSPPSGAARPFTPWTSSELNMASVQPTKR